MSVLKKIVLGLVVLVVLLVLIGFFLPSSAHVERSTVIDAPPATVFALANSFRSFNRWSPWAERDPETQYVFEGPEAGEGAKMSWASDNPQVGSGFQVIKTSRPFSLVETHLDFGSQGTAEAFLKIDPAEAGTVVTWGFDSDFGLNLVSRYMGLMFDRWIGSDYEVGLANLKRLAQSLPVADWTDMEISVVEIEPAVVVSTSSSSPFDGAAIGQALGEAYRQIGGFMATHKLQFAGAPRAVTTSSSADEWQFDAAIPIAEMPILDIDPGSPVQVREIKGGMTIRGVSVGPYAETSANWDKVRAWAAAHGYEEVGNPWEEYVSDPASTPEEELVTHLCLPVQ